MDFKAKFTDPVPPRQLSGKKVIRKVGGREVGGKTMGTAREGERKREMDGERWEEWSKRENRERMEIEDKWV